MPGAIDSIVASGLAGEGIQQRNRTIEVYIIVYLIFLFFLGLPCFVSSLLFWLLLWRRKKYLRSKVQLAFIGFGVGYLFLGLWIAQILSFEILDAFFFWYVWTCFFSPAGGLLLMNFTKYNRYFRGLTTSEIAEEELKRLEKEGVKQSQRAREVSETETAPAQQNLLTLGAVEKGDVLPPHAPLFTVDDWLLLDEKVLNQHMFILGATGAGKTEFLKRLVVETLRSSNRDVFVIDGKGERDFAHDIANLIYQYRKTSIPIFRFGFGKDESSSVYNGFNGDKDAIKNRLLALIGVDQIEGNATYYADINRDLIQLICGVGAPTINPPRSFEELRKRTSKAWLQEAYREYPQELDDIDGIPKDALDGLMWRLRHLIRDFSPYVDEQGFCLDATTGAVFSINTLSVGDAAKAFLNFFVEDVKDWIATRKDPNRPGLLIIDEFGAFGNKNIIALLSLARSMGLGVVLATQDVASISDDMVRDRILGNSVIKVVMRSDHSEDVASLAGTKKNLLVTIQGKDGDATGMTSARFEDIFKVHPNDVARFLPGECYVVYNRYATKIHSKQVGSVPRSPEAISVYKKPQKEVVKIEKQPAKKQPAPARRRREI